MKNPKSKSGGALVMVMVVMMAFVILAIGLFKLHLNDTVEAVFVEQSNQAFWLAETGMQRALHKLRREKSFRDNPGALNESFGDGRYDVNVADLVGLTNRWSIVSTGTVMNVSRIVTLDPLLTAELGYALMALDGNPKLDKDGFIDDDVYSYGKITVNGRSQPTINGDVLALDSRNLDYTPLSSDDRVEMEVDGSAFDFNPTTFDSPSYTNVTVISAGVTNTYSYLNLTGPNPIKVDGDLELDNGTVGAGTLIVTGDLTFKNSGSPFVIDDYSTIVVGNDLWAGKDGTFGQGVLVYVDGSMTLQKAAGAGSTTLLVEGDLTVNKELEFNGLIMADGSVTVDKSLTLNGSLIAGKDFWLKDGYNVTFDPSQISQDVLDNMIVYVTYAAKPGSWNEVSAF